MQRFDLLIRFVVATLALCAPGGLLVGCHHEVHPSEETVSPLRHSRQVLVVITQDWKATVGTLQRYQWNVYKNSWQPVKTPIAVSVGYNGLAWGRGLHDNMSLQSPTKHEGDGKSPAGIFPLPEVFGYTPKPANIHMPYRELTDYDLDCAINDVNSKYYNRIVRLSQVQRDWNSFEFLRRSDRLYEWGVIVAHNTQPIIPSAGSCVFLHVWRGPGVPTAGSTAMAKENMQEVVAWLDPTENPILVQLPAAEYETQMLRWKLPRPAEHGH